MAHEEKITLTSSDDLIAELNSLLQEEFVVM